MIRSPILNTLKPVTDATSIEEVLEAIGANFKVEKRPSYYISNGVHKVYQDMEIITRLDNEQGIGNCSPDYGIVQYHETLAYLNALIADKKAFPYSAAITDNGARLHVIMKADNYVELDTGEKIDYFFHVLTSHDQTASISNMVIPLHNLTQTVFTPMDRGVVKFKHSRNVHDNIRKAGSIIAKMNNEWQNYTENFRNFVNIKLTDIQLAGYFKSVFPGDTKQAEHAREKLVDIFRTGPLHSLASCKGTLWGAFMAAQIHADYYKTVKRSRTGRSEVESRIEARLTGAAARQKAWAFSMAVNMAKSSNLGNL